MTTKRTLLRLSVALAMVLTLLASTNAIPIPGELTARADPATPATPATPADPATPATPAPPATPADPAADPSVVLTPEEIKKKAVATFNCYKKAFTDFPLPSDDPKLDTTTCSALLNPTEPVVDYQKQADEA
ncbi:hypothetical protein BGX24_004259, partial [Mortierella sp. AD032]